MQSAFKLVSNLPTVNEGATIEVDDITASIVSSLNDDLNTPQAIAALFELSRRINLVNDGKEQITPITREKMEHLIRDYCVGVLGLVAEDAGAADGLSDAMDIILALRGQAKADKNWALS